MFSTTLLVALFLLVFWYVYILVMGLYRAHLQGRLNKITTALAFPALIIGYVMDVFANFTIAWVVFLEPPYEMLVTTRLKHYMTKNEDNWRRRWAEWICTHLLDPFDPSGNHC